MEADRSGPERSSDPAGPHALPVITGVRNECCPTSTHEDEQIQGNYSLSNPTETTCTPGGSRPSATGLRECLKTLSTSDLNRIVSDVEHTGHTAQASRHSRLLQDTVDLLEEHGDSRIGAASILLHNLQALTTECEQQRRSGASGASGEWDAWTGSLVFSHVYAPQSACDEIHAQ
jgi:hypothetical protein